MANLVVDDSSLSISTIAATVGSSENALRLLLSLFAAYPLAFLYRQLFYGQSPRLQHVYFILCGLALAYFNFGTNTVHSIINILIVHLILQTIGGTKTSVAVAFTINMTYLVIGYYSVMSPNYTIRWTTAHCVLTLRLTGLVFDVYDGRKKVENLSAEQKETALTKTPSLLEIAGFTYYFGGFLVGPQFSLRRYLDFVNGAFSDKVTGGKPASVTPGLLRLIAGIVYIAVFQLGSIYCTDSYLLSEEFENLSFVMKALYVMIWGKITLCKYAGSWLIVEGACIITGLTYNGKDENGNNLWDACTNIKLQQLEMGYTLRHTVQSFNVNTNLWMAKYVFKRLKFLGNRDLSMSITLLTLAIWHGLYSGYFMCFFLEFMLVKFEREVESLWSKNEMLARLHHNPVLSLIILAVTKMHSLFTLGYALVGFCLFTYDKWWKVYQSLHYVVHLETLIWMVVYPLIRTLLVSKPRSQNGTAKSTKTE